MSKLETPMTHWYWKHVGGTLIEEFCAVRRSSTCGVRLLDRVIIKGGEFRIAKQSEVSLEGKDIVIVQTKNARLGMYLMGQAFFFGATHAAVSSAVGRVRCLGRSGR